MESSQDMVDGSSAVENMSQSVEGTPADSTMEVPTSENSGVTKSETQSVVEEEAKSEGDVEEGEEGVEDLFGDDDDEVEGDDDNKGGDDDMEDSDEDAVTRRRRNYLDEEEDEEQAMYTRKFYGEDEMSKEELEDAHDFKEADVEVVRHVVPYKTAPENGESTISIAKIPPFLTIDPVPFDPVSFETHVKERILNAGTEEEQLGDRLIDENMIRWRYSRDENQRVLKESNAKVIQWSDGSYSLKLGDEYTDILVNETDNTLLTVSHDEQELMQCVNGGEITKSMMFVPISTQSKLHQRLSKAVLRRNQRDTLGPRSYLVNVDPEVEKKELEKKQSQMFRERRKKRQREIEALQDAPDSAGFGNNSYGSTKKRGSTPSYLSESRGGNEYEEDDFVVDDDDEADYGEEDEEEEEEAEDEEDDNQDDNDEEDKLNAEKLRDVKRGTNAFKQDEEEDSNGNETRDDSNSQEAPKRRKIAVIEDDEE